jgi:hypothetical protein
VRVSSAKKNLYINNYFASLKSLKKGVRSGVGSDPLVRDTDPRIPIRTKMSRIPNTVYNVTADKYQLPDLPLKSEGCRQGADYARLEPLCCTVQLRPGNTGGSPCRTPREQKIKTMRLENNNQSVLNDL